MSRDARSADANHRTRPAPRVSETALRRMLDPKHETKPEKIQAALAALGKLT